MKQRVHSARPPRIHPPHPQRQELQQAGALWFYMRVEVNSSGAFDIVSSMLLLLLSPLQQGHNDCTADREIYRGLQFSSQKIPQMFAVMQT